MFKKLVMLTAMMIVALAAMAGSAAASTISLSPAGEFTMQSEGKVTFSGEEGETRVECSLTYTGTLARGPILLEETEPSGAVTGVRWSECTGGEIEAALSLGWMTHWAILGRFPNGITGILAGLTGNISLHILFIRCLYSGEIGMLAGAAGTNPYTGFHFTFLGITITRVSGGFPCPARIRIGGTMVMRPEQTITAR
jgi:hypothetical protein